MNASLYTTLPSFRTEQAEVFFPVRSSEPVGLRREKSLFAFAFVASSFLCGPLAQSSSASLFSVPSVFSALSVLNPILCKGFSGRCSSRLPRRAPLMEAPQ
jgi:hypothetical protein